MRIRKGVISCCFYAWGISLGLILGLLVYWEIFLCISLGLGCSYSKPPNCPYNLVLIGGIACLTIYAFVAEFGGFYVLVIYDSKSSEMEKENSGLEEQIASLERQLNQGIRTIQRENRPPNKEVNQSS